MLTLATVEVEINGTTPDESEINVDVDDNGFAYIKQGDDWIAFPVKYTDAVIRALGNVWR